MSKFTIAKQALTVHTTDTPNFFTYVVKDATVSDHYTVAVHPGIEQSTEFDQFFTETLEYVEGSIPADYAIRMMNHRIVGAGRRGEMTHLFANQNMVDNLATGIREVTDYTTLRFTVIVDPDIPDNTVFGVRHAIRTGPDSTAVDSSFYYTPDGKLFVNPGHAKWPQCVKFVYTQNNQP